jgi:dTDP-4-dehydrorhamnose 3,5-epimerase
VSSPPPGDRPSVLLTGATSYLGVSLVDHLQRSGSTVTAVVRPTSPIERFDGLERAPTVRVHDGTTSSLVDIVEDVAPGVVVHLATLYRREHTVEDVEGLIVTNVLLGAQLLEAMRRSGHRRLVGAATYFQHYDTDGFRPLNLYAATKQAFEDVLAYYVDAHAFEAITLVLYDVYGPGDWRPKLMDAIRNAQQTGEPLALPERDVEMDLVYVADAVAAIARAVTMLDAASVAGAERYAVGSGRRCRLSELISLFEEVAGRPVPHEWGRYPTPERAIATPWVGTTSPRLGTTLVVARWHPAVPRRYLTAEPMEHRMQIEPLALPEVKVVTLDVFADARGVFAETYDRAKFVALGIHDVFVQDSYSRSARAGTVRGFHFQRPPRAQSKLVRVTRGRAFDVAVDLRRGSPTYGRHVSMTLEEGDWKVVYVPAGFGHGFCTLEPDTEVVYKMSDSYSAEHYAGVRWDDPALGIDWPVEAASAVVSPADRGHPALADLEDPGFPTDPEEGEAP